MSSPRLGSLCLIVQMCIQSIALDMLRLSCEGLCPKSYMSGAKRCTPVYNVLCERHGCNNVRNLSLDTKHQGLQS